MSGSIWEKQQNESLFPHAVRDLLKADIICRAGSCGEFGLAEVGGALPAWHNQVFNGKAAKFCKATDLGECAENHTSAFGTVNQLENILWGLILENVYAHDESTRSNGRPVAD